MHHKMIVEKTKIKSETSEKEHTRKKATSRSLKNTKTISPKLFLFSIHPHNTQSHSQSHHSSSQCHKPFICKKDGWHNDTWKEEDTCQHHSFLSQTHQSPPLSLTQLVSSCFFQNQTQTNTTKCGQIVLLLMYAACVDACGINTKQLPSHFHTIQPLTHPSSLFQPPPNTPFHQSSVPAP